MYECGCMGIILSELLFISSYLIVFILLVRT